MMDGLAFLLSGFFALLCLFEIGRLHAKLKAVTEERDAAWALFDQASMTVFSFLARERQQADQRMAPPQREQA
jgi:drug/metabolite transporter superfamily protein YnfA